MLTIAEVIVALLGFSGFLLANYIRDTKKNATPLVCPLEGSCETVIYSKYSKIMNVPVELLGVIYYGFITLVYFLFAFFPNVIPEEFSYVTLGLTVAAFLFSIYLTAVQSLLLKHWCTWCLISAGICTTIFLIVFYFSNEKILEIVQSL